MSYVLFLIISNTRKKDFVNVPAFKIPHNVKISPNLPEIIGNSSFFIFSGIIFVSFLFNISSRVIG